MSTTGTATTKRKGLPKASASRMPTLACVGYVADVGEGKEAKSGKYNVNPIEIHGLGASRNVTVYFLSRPEWFETNEEGNAVFRPDKLESVEGGRGMLFVYQKNVSQNGNISLLEGVCGNVDRFEEVQGRLLSEEGVAGDDSASVIESVLGNFLVAKEGENPTEIGYILRQQSTKTDETDEDGKAIYILENRYEVSEWFEATEANKKKFRKRAEKSAEKAEAANEPVRFKVAFDDGSPF